MRGLPVTLMLLIVAFAGCADDAPPSADGTVEGGVDEETFELQAGKGAIEGILVDDRFRPIDLEDEPETEFQTTGFVLLQETGQQVQTDENGQFAFVDLEPGQYTLRVTAGGHEAIPARITVEEGLFAEAQVLARRVVSEGSLIITEEYSVFVPCVFTAVALAYSPDCTFDQSGETQRFAFYPNYTAVTDITYMVTEMRLSSPAGGASGSWGVSVRDPSAVTNGIYYAEGALKEGDYLKLVNPRGAISEHGSRNTYWNNTIDFQVALFGQGLLQDELNSGTCDLPSPVGRCTWGFGVQAGQRAHFLVSLFIGPPELDVETYCVLCS